MCLAQFSIQGPSDGHRRAQGLKFSQEKGIEYTDASGKWQTMQLKNIKTGKQFIFAFH